MERNKGWDNNRPKQVKNRQRQQNIERETVKHRDCYMVRYRDRVRDSKTHTYVYKKEMQ